MKKDTNGLFKSSLERDKELMSNPFSVPDGYFEELESRTMMLSRLSELKDGGMQVPDGYFEGLTGRILQAVEAEAETAALSVVKEEGAVIRQLPESDKGWVRRLVSATGMRYAAAAIILVFSVFLIQHRLVDNRNPLADISDQELIHYLQFYGGTGDALVISENLNLNQAWTETASDLSAEDIEWYLENTW